MINDRAMLAVLHISVWPAVKHDRKVSREVANRHGAQESAGRYNKQLLRGAEKLDELLTLAGQVRLFLQGHAALVRRRLPSAARALLLRTHHKDARVRERIIPASRRMSKSPPISSEIGLN